MKILVRDQEGKHDANKIDNEKNTETETLSRADEWN